ncbi:MAG: hypothetical protein Q8J78_13925 [Moraxellaceae bacterium]|nr:hypothetical protein [Moraxellaceae bacterium]
MTLTSPAAPVASIEDVARVVSILTANKGLEMKAAEIARAMGLEVTENSKRKVRAIARAARPGILSFPSSQGYKLTDDCTLAEIEACIAAWDSVIRDATATKMLYQDRRHGRRQ